METLRICIGCNEGIRLAPTHMGDTREFRIFDVSPDHEANFIGTRVNTAIDMAHTQADKMKQILDILQDVHFCVAQTKSPNFQDMAAKTRHQPVVVKTDTVADALRLIQRSFHEIRGLVERRQRGERPVKIPTLRLRAE
jgi:hypothetical protein